MVFVSKNKIRKCRWCDKPQTEILGKLQKNGKVRKKGYYLTCGDEKCRKMQYNDSYICRLKGLVNDPKDFVCLCCNEIFKGEHSNHKRYCKVCVPNKAWRSRAFRYRIGKKQWDEMLLKQGGTCGLCNRNPEVIDHCHNTGIVRGLLCNKCNGHIKFLDRDKEFMKKCIKYTGVKNVSIC